MALADSLGSYSLGWALFAGLAGGAAFLIVVYVGVISRVTTMHYMYIVGSLILPRASSMVDHGLGFLIHMAILSTGLGLAHAAILHALGVSSVSDAVAWELLLGVLQWALLVNVIPALLALRRPPVRWGHINNPGFLLLRFGRSTPFVVLGENLLFALLVGAVYSAILL